MQSYATHLMLNSTAFGGGGEKRERRQRRRSKIVEVGRRFCLPDEQEVRCRGRLEGPLKMREGRSSWKAAQRCREGENWEKSASSLAVETLLNAREMRASVLY
jgi:hypothetical protein